MTAPVVLYNCGMSGMQCFDRRFLDELRRGGLTVRPNKWTTYRWPLRNLRDRELHRRASDRLLELIHTTRKVRPNTPVALIGHSTGALVVLETLQRLSEPIDTAILLAAAVTPDADLTPALARCRRMIHIGSRLDVGLCGVGTTVCGTADGLHRPAAACVGLRGPSRDDPRFTERMYRPGWSRFGHLGGHVGCLNRRFARHQILPLLRGETGSAEPPNPPPTDVAERRG